MGNFLRILSNSKPHKNILVVIRVNYNISTCKATVTELMLTCSSLPASSSTVHLLAAVRLEMLSVCHPAFLPEKRKAQGFS